jgi:cytochrome c biogenesis protein ResB
MLPVSVFLCFVSNVARVYLSVSCAQCYQYLSFCVLCQMLPVSIFLCLMPNVTRVYLSVSCTQCTRLKLGTGHRTIDTGNIEHKTQKDRYGQHWTQDTERQTRVPLDTKHRNIDTGNIGHKTKTQKDKHG